MRLYCTDDAKYGTHGKHDNISPSNAYGYKKGDNHPFGMTVRLYWKVGAPINDAPIKDG